MANQHLISCKQTFNDIARRAIAICHDFEDRNDELKALSQQFEKNFKDRLKDFNPKIMVYGIYNAGKSTMLNALVGEEKAATGDVPTTCKIQPFYWNEYTIYDTPGIDAPKKDEEVSKEQLEKSDVIIFVMDTEGAFSLGKNYRELIEIVHKGKKLLIVLNNKSGFSLEDKDDVFEIEKIKKQIYVDFSEKYRSVYKNDESDLAAHSQIIVIDALTAFRARTDKTLSEKEREIFLESSNIEALESAIIEEYGKVSEFTVLKELGIQLKENLDKLSEVVTELNKNSLVKDSVASLNELSKLKDDLTSKVCEYTRDHGIILGDEIYNTLINCDGNQEEAQRKICELSNSLSEKVYKYMVAEIGNLSKDISAIFDNFKKNILPPDIEIKMRSDNNNEMENTFNMLPQQNGNGSNGNNEIVATTMATMAAMTPKLAKTLTKSLVPIVSKIPVIGTFVAKIVPPLIPMVLIYYGAKLLFGSSSEEKRVNEEYERARALEQAQMRQNEEIARRKEEVKYESNRIARKIVSELNDEARKLIDQVFEPNQKQIQGIIEKCHSEEKNLLSTLNQISEMKIELDNVISKFCEY